MESPRILPGRQAELPPVLAAELRGADVVDAVWRAADDETGQLRFPAGPDAIAMAQYR
ncbi:hypothetical protein [Patulibacter americanus]|uniref:hypothetical protein n=1 Tax=Patulibacter americanus TaxID=588672 RepID=UPI0003B5C901|nr:hypothetical protein [Patulibacter americanus]